MAKYEAETLLGVEAEAPSAGPVVPQAATRGTGLSLRLVRGCAVVCATLCAVPALVQASRSFRRTSALEHAIPQQLSELHHWTDFGTVPDTLHVSGIDCYGFTGQRDRNGEYHFGGTTGEGRAWYVQDPDRFRQNEKTAVLFYDRECDGEKGGQSNRWGGGVLDHGKKEEWDFGRSEMMRVDGRCQTAAHLDVQSGDGLLPHGGPWYLDQEPGPAPPTKALWHVWCGPTINWQVQNVAVLGTAHVQGHWQFLYLAIPGTRVTLKHGKRELTSNNRDWRMQGKDGVQVGGDTDFGLVFLSANASREVTSSLADSWSHETEYSGEVSRELKLPKGSGGAFYQWVLTATTPTPNKESLDVLTQSFAFTTDLFHPPRCYPGGSTDGFHYQTCNPGWQLSEPWTQSTVQAAVPALDQATRSFQRTSVLKQLSELHHRTDLGTVPDTLHISGIDCYGSNSQRDKNGKYHFGGTTGEGRAWYVQDPDRFRQNEKTAVLFYDRECDGKKDGEDNLFGEWVLVDGKKEEWDFGRPEMMRVDGECTYSARVSVETGANRTPWHLDQEPGPAPPTKARWRVWCGETVGWQVQTVWTRIMTASIHGRWQFLYSAMPNERVTLKHGKRERSSNNRKWRTQGKDHIEVGGDVDFRLVFVSGNASHEVTGSLASSWSNETEHSTEVVREFKLPKDSGSAFYQWVLTATTPDKESLDVLTQSFTFTPDAAHPPRCYPGGSTDGFHYQKCNPGWQLS